MVRFADARHIQVKFLVDDQQGLKIPNSAIVEKEFYLIPKEFLIEQEDSKGFLKEIYDDSGQATAQFVNMTLYYEDDDYYYYVKAVPKIAISRTDVKVQEINKVKRR